MNYILSYDCGTGGTKASIYDENGGSRASVFIAFETYYTENGYHEQCPRHWWESIVSSTSQLLARAGVPASDIECLAISGHGLGVAPIDKDGNLLLERVPIWSDARAEEQAERFFEKIDYNKWYLETGASFPPATYAAFKVMWYRDNYPELYDKAYKFLGTKDYINYLLTGNIATDYSYASGSGIFKLKDWRYDDEYVRATGLSIDKFAELIGSSEAVVGTLLPEMAKLLGLRESVTVSCGGNDTSCMALGAGCVSDGVVYTSVGSSSWIATSAHEPIVNIEKKPYVFAHCIPGMFVSATSIFSAGSAHRWLRDTLCINLKERAEREGRNVFELMDELAAASPLGANRLLFNPSLAGGSEIDRTANVRGSFMGLALTHTQGDVIRSVLEGICLNLRVAMDLLDDCYKLSDEMLLVGGGANSEFWRQMFADTFHKKIVRTSVGQDAGALGAAAVAAVGRGMWSDYSIIPNIHKVISVQPPIEENAIRYERLLETYIKTIEIQYELGDMITQMVF